MTLKTANSGPTHYATLGAAVCASAKELAKAYRKRALECHPDKGGDESTFQAVKEAYDVLKDAARRSEYDKLLLASHRMAIRESEEEKRQARERALELERIRRQCESNAEEFWQQQENKAKNEERTTKDRADNGQRSPLKPLNGQRTGSQEEEHIEPSQRVVYIAGGSGTSYHWKQHCHSLMGGRHIYQTTQTIACERRKKPCSTCCR
mmetsp:Transcript_28340/g.62080  ORF Transcript_28340/g.62080 Transcript_28340/m.62080 type:complete len:208 (-) Transcript_28340:66-689(-)